METGPEGPGRKVLASRLEPHVRRHTAAYHEKFIEAQLNSVLFLLFHFESLLLNLSHLSLRYKGQSVAE